MSKREENELKLKRSKLEMRKKGKREGRKRRRWVYKEEWEGPPPAPLGPSRAIKIRKLPFPHKLNKLIKYLHTSPLHICWNSLNLLFGTLKPSLYLYLRYLRF